MPVLPWRPLASAVANTVTAAADWASDAIPQAVIDIATAAYVPPQPPEPLDYCGIVHDTSTGMILELTPPSTLSDLAAARDKLISSSDGERSMTIVEKGVAQSDLGRAMLKPGQPTSMVLSVIEEQQRAGYRLYIDDKCPVL